MKHYKVVGKSVERTDARVKVTGSARYAADLVAPGMLHGKILRSPLAHARILNIDTSRARRYRVSWPSSRARTFRHPLRHEARHEGPASHAYHQGAPFGEGVAAVAAIDEDTAEEALDLIKVDYEELPVVLTAQDALAPGAPLVNEFKKSNIAYFLRLCVRRCGEGVQGGGLHKGRDFHLPARRPSASSSRTPASPRSTHRAGCSSRARSKAPISRGATCAGPLTSPFRR